MAIPDAEIDYSDIAELKLYQLGVNILVYALTREGSTAQRGVRQ